MWRFGCDVDGRRLSGICAEDSVLIGFSRRRRDETCNA